MDKGNAKPVKKWMFAAGIALLALLFVVCLSLTVSGSIEKSRYKLAYPDQINRYAAEFGVDPVLVASVIHCESGNRPKVRSKSGAVGLMQIMPATGEWIAGKLDISQYQEALLEDPEINIRMGCWYIHFLQQRYQGNQRHVLAAYNAGHGNMDGWLDDERYSDGGLLTYIPIEETRDYVEKVQRAYEKYKKYYGAQLGG